MHYLTKLESQMMFFLSDYQATETGHQTNYYNGYGKVNSIKNVENPLRTKSVSWCPVFVRVVCSANSLDKKPNQKKNAWN